MLGVRWHLVAVLALAVVMSAVAMSRMRAAPRRTRPTPVLGVGAYFHGGTPARDPALETFLVDNLTELLIETDAARMGDLDGAPRARRVSELRNAKEMAAHGPGLEAAWRELIDSLDRWAKLHVGGARLRTAVDELGTKAQAVSNEFARLGLGYYLQADALLGNGAHAVVFVYRVEDVTFVHVGGERRRVLGLRRLDQINLDLAMLGRQSDESADPVVLLDRIDHFIETRVDPLLRGGDDSSAGFEIADELRAAGASDRAAMTKLIIATVRRHEARHGFDLERIDAGYPLRYPVALRGALGPHSKATMRAELELAAYLSQIGNEPIVPKLALWNVQSVGESFRGSAESYAARIIVEGLARKLGVHPEQLLFQGDDALRTAARLLWVDLYGEPMLPITD